MFAAVHYFWEVEVSIIIKISFSGMEKYLQKKIWQYELYRVSYFNMFINYLAIIIGQHRPTNEGIPIASFSDTKKSVNFYGGKSLLGQSTSRSWR